MQIHIETGDWKTLQHPCERIRLLVFVAEQGVPKAEDLFGTAGEGFERINIACPRATLEDGLDRMKNCLENMLDER